MAGHPAFRRGDNHLFSVDNIAHFFALSSNGRHQLPSPFFILHF
jgi:hypothetical protein